MAQEEPPVATLVAPARRGVPPGRVQRAYKKLDADSNMSLTLKELQKGLDAEFGGLSAAAAAAVPALFTAHAEQTAHGGVAIPIGKFSRFYAEIMFKHFDSDGNGMLQVEEAQKAFAHLIKPGTGVGMPTIPGNYLKEGGKLYLTLKGFWQIFTAME